MSVTPANFHDLYQRYSRDVYRFALYLSGNEAWAEDIAAEAFLRIWASPAPTHLATVKNYLFAIVRNLHAENWRRGRREASLPDDLAAGGSASEVERAAEAKAELQRVMFALQRIDAVERAALLLRGEHGLAYEEIARILEITPGAARVKVHRARQALLPARRGEMCK